MNNSYFTSMQQCEILRTQLDAEIVSFKPYYKDISRYILPRRSRFFVSDVNQGDRRNTDIIDATASLAARTLSSGMMTGVTSPARPWFRLAGPSLLQESEAVKKYLKDVEEMMRSIFLRSNLYNVLPVLYGDLGCFGTACIFMEEDFESTVNFTSFLIGSYRIGCDKKGRVRVFTREFQMTVRQIVEKFGKMEEGSTDIDWTNISEAVKNQWDQKQYESRVDITHIIKPNNNYKPHSVLSKHKKFISLYYEKGMSSTGTSNMATGGLPEKFLSEKGYRFFPVLAPRWEVAGEDTYGTNCPGMMSLGDVKQLQLGEIRSASAIDQKVKPSMVGPLSLKTAKASILPGDITYVDEREGTKGFRRLFEIDFDIRELEGKQDQIRQRISRIFYEDLFLMLANSNRSQITAREIEERHEEKLLALGPVLERLNQDLLDPLIENTFMVMEAQGLLPEAPEELQGQDFKVEYISVMAQAQKLAGIGNIERLFGFVAQAAQLSPEAAEKVDVEKAIEIYGELAGAPPSIIISEEKMDEKKQEMAAAQQKEQEMMEQGAMIQGAKDLSQTQMTEDSALNELLNSGEPA